MSVSNSNPFERFVGVYRPINGKQRREIVFQLAGFFFLTVCLVPALLVAFGWLLLGRIPLVVLLLCVPGLYLYVRFVKVILRRKLLQIEVKPAVLEISFNDGFVQKVELSKIDRIQINHPGGDIVIIMKESSETSCARVPAWFPKRDEFVAVVKEHGIECWTTDPSSLLA